MTLPAWFIRQKGLQTTKHYKEMQNAAHARAFTVVRIAQLSALGKIKKEIEQAVGQGKPWQQFQKDYKANQRAPLPKWHLKTVFQTNLQAAYMAGRHAAALEAAETHPYWLYLAEMDAYTRPNHAMLHGKAFRHDDPVWASITPPNGYNCRCRFVALSEQGLKQWGVKAERGNPQTMRPDAGFDSAPMAAHSTDKLLWQRATDTLGEKAGRDFVQSVLTHPARLKGWQAFVDSVLHSPRNAAPPQGRAMAFGVLPLADMAFVQKQGAALQNGLVFLEERQFTGDKRKRHKEAGNALTEDELKALPERFAKLENTAGAIALWDSADNLLIYLLPDGKDRFYKIPVRFNRNTYGGMAIDDATTVFKITRRDIGAMHNQAHIQQIR